ncbi:MAG: ABC transporter ATP-binding protein [Thiohalobacterales bacterium]|nr:ABC transporter ATP-binding protein [Thiohalobacterales bacterium]
MTPSLSVQGLTKRFGDTIAVDQLDLELFPGQIFGLLGPNAAGKSTTIRMLAGIIRPTGGSASVLGLDLVGDSKAIKSRIGYVAQHFGLYPELTVEENLAFYSSLHRSVPRTRQTALLEQYNLLQFAHRPAGHLSGGYKRRLSIVCAISHDPDLVFLDEPTAGIDPVTRKELWDVFYDLAATGMTLFVTTHYMEEAERCHRLCFLSRGRRVAYGAPDEIRRLLGHMRVYSFTGTEDPCMISALSQLQGVRLINRFGLRTRLVVDETLSHDELVRFLNGWRDTGADFREESVNLEDVFITLTGDEAA